MKRMIVTGGAGFIGANFVRVALAESDAEVVVFDALTYAGSLESLRDVEDHPRYRFVRGDIAEASDVAQLFSDHPPDAIVNFAAESHVDRSIDGPAAFIRTNINGTFELLDAARHFVAAQSPDARDGFRFLHVSTDEVYGSLDATGAFLETTPYAPNSPYAASKASADHLVRAYGETFELPVIITNCSNNYGPFQFPEKLIPLMVLNALEGRDLPIYGSGLNVRDWIFVEDHCRGVLRALLAGTPGEKYNLGGLSERTNIQVIDAICDELGARRPAAENAALAARGVDSYQALKTFVADRPGHDQRYAIDCSKAEKELGWTPQHDFEQGLRHTIGWYLDNAEWCASVSPDARARRGKA